MIIIKPIPVQSTYSIRGLVFECDSHDKFVRLEQDFHPTTLHLGVFVDNELVGVGSLVIQDLKGVPALRLRAIAIKPEHQKKGIGKKLVSELVAKARVISEQNPDLELLWLSSFQHQTEFYKSLGFFPRGPVYLRLIDGPSQNMILPL